MNKEIIFKLISYILLILGFLMILLSGLKPQLLIKTNKIKVNKGGYIKYKQRYYYIYGIISVFIAMLSLNKTIGVQAFCIILIISNLIFTIIDSIIIKKYI